MIRAGGRRTAIFASSSIHPPPAEITIPDLPANSWVMARSIARNSCSPRLAKISDTGIRSRRSISRSRSMNWASRAAASSGPTVLFPDPGRPTRTMCGRRLVMVSRPSVADSLVDAGEVAVDVSTRLVEGIATELLQPGLREHERDHRFRNDAHRRDRGDIAALGRRLRFLAGFHVHRA